MPLTQKLRVLGKFDNYGWHAIIGYYSYIMNMNMSKYERVLQVRSMVRQKLRIANAHESHMITLPDEGDRK